MANSTIKFPQEMPPAANINGSDKIMISDAATNEAKSATWDAAKQYLNITGIELKPIAPGPLPAGPDGEVRFMKVTAVGSWTFGGATVAANAYGYQTTLWWDGTTWSDAGTVRVEGPMPEGTDVLEPELIPKGKAVESYVEPIFNQFEDDQVEVIISDNDIYSSVSYYDDTSTFIGFGFTHSAIQNFNSVKIWHRDMALLAGRTKVTLLNVRVCEDNMNGAELAYIQNIPVSFEDGESGWIIATFPNILNSSNKPIWVEYWGNGNMACFASTEDIPSQTFRWKSAGSVGGKFNVASGSTAFSSERAKALLIPFCRLETVLSPNQDMSNTVLDKGDAVGIIHIDEKKAVNGDTIFKAIEPFSEAISKKFIPDTIIDMGGNASITATSTFAGWGQNKGVLANFNAVGYNIIAFSPTEIPTYIEMRLRDTNELGAVLSTVRVDVELQHNVPQEVVFIMDEVFANLDEKEIFVQFNADGRIALTGYGHGGVAGSVKFTTALGASTTLSSTPGSNTNTLGIRIILGEYKSMLSDATMEIVKNEVISSLFIPPTPNLILTNKTWIYPTFQYNIFSKNVLVTDFGDNSNNYRLDFNGSVGQQFNRGFRNNATASMDSNITLSVMQGREVLFTKSQTILSTTTNNGNGVTRNVLIVGDSTVNSSNISTPLKTVFDTDVMNINLIGTLGASGVKHEGRGGWTINDYYGYGRSLYQINVGGITTAPSINARYTQGTGVYNVEEVNITGGSGYFSVSVVSGTAPTLGGGILNKTSGSGDSSISYYSAAQTSANPFYSPSTERFDLGHYLTSTNQTMSNGDWICFQLGINDVFGLTDLTAAVNKTNQMANQMSEIIANIKAYNPNIRVGLVVTFPPADQDAFGANYTLGQLSEMYTKTGLVTWQNKLISDFDNDTKRGEGIYLISAHLNLDVDYNYATADVAVNSRNPAIIKMQNNGVHPNAMGYAQIADMYAGLIKYFG